MRLVNYLAGLVVGLAAPVVHAAELPHISMNQAIALSIGSSSLAHREIRSSAMLIVGSESTLAPIGARDVDPEVVRKWVAMLAGKSIWKIRICPLDATGTARFCLITLIDAESGSNVSWP
ncbi:MAG: hypothetical protein V4582_10695 [Pseudomonadota bacterium]